MEKRERKNISFPDRDRLLLTKGLLMGDPRTPILMQRQLKECLAKITLFQIKLKVFRKNYPILRSYKSTRLLLMIQV